MKLILVIFTAFFITNVAGQGNTLYSALMITPKEGKSAAFETAWKTHLGKYHGQSDGRVVHEVLSGDNAGSYWLFDGPSSFADMDIVRPTEAAHDADYNNTVSAQVQKSSGSYTYRWVDTLSFNGVSTAEKYQTTVYNLKPGKMAEFTAEIKRAIQVNKSLNSPSSYNTYIKQWAGSQPQVVIMTNLKNGFKQLDNTYDTTLNPKFKAEYIKQFGQEVWDKRLLMVNDLTLSYEVYISRLRKDLSTVAVKK